MDLRKLAALAVLILGNLAFAQTVSLLSPDQNATLNSADVSFVFNATDENSSVLGCTLVLDGANQSSVLASNATATSVNVSGMPAGDHSWFVSCTDEANSTGVSETRNFSIVLASPPSVSLDSPADNATLNSSTVDFLFTAAEPHNESMVCTLLLDGAANASVPASSGVEGNISVSGIASGAHGWSVSCTDTENETGSSGTRSFSISLPPADSDHDGVPDSEDMCPASVPDNMTLNPNQYGWLDSSSSLFESGPAKRQSTVYNMTGTKGCTCAQIVAKLGLGKGQLKKGCSPGIMQRWTGLNAVPDLMSHARASPGRGRR